jgi:hypothetical protein
MIRVAKDLKVNFFRILAMPFKMDMFVERVNQTGGPVYTFKNAHHAHEFSSGYIVILRIKPNLSDKIALKVKFFV